MNAIIHQALFSHPLFESLDELSPQLLQSIRQKSLEKNEVLYRPGCEARYAYLIASGSIKFDFSLNSGKEVFVEIVDKGFVIGELEILSGFDQPISRFRFKIYQEISHQFLLFPTRCL
jgi:CRP-like cAMP-binding protein